MNYQTFAIRFAGLIRVFVVKAISLESAVADIRDAYAIELPLLTWSTDA